MFGCWGQRFGRLYVQTSGMSRILKIGPGLSMFMVATKAVHAEEVHGDDVRDGGGGSPLDLSQIPQQSSHKFLLSQSSVLCIEAASRTLHQSVVALKEVAASYSSHLSELAALLELGGDGLPLAYTSSEIYDKMVDLRLELRREKRQLAELNLLFGCCKRVLENAGETAFLVGAEFSALQAGERMAGAERAVEQSLHLARALESNVQVAERKHIERAGKAEETRKKEKEKSEQTKQLEIPLPPQKVPPLQESYEEPKVSTYETPICDIKAADDKIEKEIKVKPVEEDCLLLEERKGEGFRDELDEEELLTDGGGMEEKEDGKDGYRLPTF